MRVGGKIKASVKTLTKKLYGKIQSSASIGLSNDINSNWCFIIFHYDVLFMVALCNRETIYIFMLWFVVLLLSFFFFPRLISAVGDWMSTILRHMVWS